MVEDDNTSALLVSIASRDRMDAAFLEQELSFDAITLMSVLFTRSRHSWILVEAITDDLKGS
jgi:hypothetical protein